MTVVYYKYYTVVDSYVSNDTFYDNDDYVILHTDVADIGIYIRIYRKCASVYKSFVYENT